MCSFTALNSSVAQLRLPCSAVGGGQLTELCLKR